MLQNLRGLSQMCGRSSSVPAPTTCRQSTRRDYEEDPCARAGVVLRSLCAPSPARGIPAGKRASAPRGPFKRGTRRSTSTGTLCASVPPDGTVAFGCTRTSDVFEQHSRALRIGSVPSTPERRVLWPEPARRVFSTQTKANNSPFRWVNDAQLGIHLEQDTRQVSAHCASTQLASHPAESNMSCCATMDEQVESGASLDNASVSSIQGQAQTASRTTLESGAIVATSHGAQGGIVCLEAMHSDDVANRTIPIPDAQEHETRMSALENAAATARSHYEEISAACREVMQSEAAKARELLSELAAFRQSAEAQASMLRAQAIREVALQAEQPARSRGRSPAGSGNDARPDGSPSALTQLAELRAVTRARETSLEARAAGAAAGCAQARESGKAAEAAAAARHQRLLAEMSEERDRWNGAGSSLNSTLPQPAVGFGTSLPLAPNACSHERGPELRQ